MRVGRLGWRHKKAWLAVALSCVLSPAFALQALDDSQLEKVDGSGLAFVLENIKAQMGPQSFNEAIGSTPTGTPDTLQQSDYFWFGWSISGDGSSGTQWAPTAAGSPNACSTTATNSGTATTVAGNLGCAVGTNTIANMAAFDNPFVLRVAAYSAPDLNGTAGVSNTVLEFMAPTCVGEQASASAAPSLGCGSSTQKPEDNYRWSFWGAFDITSGGSGNTATTSGDLKSQTIIDGVPAAYLYPTMIAGTGGSGSYLNMYQGAILRIFRTVPLTSAAISNGQNPLNGTLGLNYASELSGDFRFSVGQASTVAAANDADNCGAGDPCTSTPTLAQIAVVPNFDNTEGLYFRNVQAFLPLGRLHYMSIVAGVAGSVASTGAGSGNFDLELTQLPNFANDYNDYYALASGDTTGYITAHDAQCPVGGGGVACTSGTYDFTKVPANYYETHGYVQWGSGQAATYTLPNATDGTGSLGTRPYNPPAACIGANAQTTGCYTTATDGIYFASGSNLTQTFTAAATDSDPQNSQSYTTGNLTVVNLGTSTMQGILFQHLKITTLGAN